MTKRLNKFRSFKEHPALYKIYNRLTPMEISIAERFIEENADLKPNAFEEKTVRMWLDNPNKPRNWVAMEELLMGCASEI